MVYTLWIMTDLSVTAYIQKSSLPDYNLFPPTSNLFCSNLAQLSKTWLTSSASLFLTSHFFTIYSSFHSFTLLTLLPTLISFKFGFIGISAAVFKDFWSQNFNRFLNFLRTGTASKGYSSLNLDFFNSQYNFRLCCVIIVIYEPYLTKNLISQQFQLNLQSAYF